MKKKMIAMGIALNSVLAVSAFPKEYKLSSLEIVLHLDCTTGKISAGSSSRSDDALLPLVGSTSPLAQTEFRTTFEGPSNGFSYSMDSGGRIVLTKKKSPFDFFAHDVSITLGTPQVDMAQECKSRPSSNGLLGEFVPVQLAANVKAVEDIEWTGSCQEHSLWPNDSGVAYYKPFRQSLIITDLSGNESIRMVVNPVADLGNSHNSSIAACNATDLP